MHLLLQLHELRILDVPLSYIFINCWILSSLQVTTPNCSERCGTWPCRLDLFCNCSAFIFRWKGLRVWCDYKVILRHSISWSLLQQLDLCLSLSNFILNIFHLVTHLIKLAFIGTLKGSGRLGAILVINMLHIWKKLVNLLVLCCLLKLLVIWVLLVWECFRLIILD